MLISFYTKRISSAKMSDSSEKYGLPISSKFSSWKVADTPLLYLIVAANEHLQFLKNLETPNAMERGLRDGLSTSSIPKLATAVSDFCKANPYDDLTEINQKVMNSIYRRLKFPVNKTYNSQSILSSDNIMIGAVCAAIDQRLEFVNSKLYHINKKTKQVTVEYDGVSSSWLCDTFAPFIDNLTELANGLTSTVRQVITAAKADAKAEAEQKRASYQAQVQMQYPQPQFPQPQIPGLININGNLFVVAQTPRGPTYVPVMPFMQAPSH